MEILVLNLGSSSIKFKLFDMKENKPLASGLAEKIGEEIGQLKIKSHLHHNDQELKEKLVIKDHASGLFNAISLHLGNGSSAAAIQKGKSVDTSMGLTPLEGLIMGTRCGDIDPTVVEYTAQCANKSLEEVMKILNHESGLKGICGDNEKHRSQKRKRR